jgi:hypothetical protein
MLRCPAYPKQHGIATRQTYSHLNWAGDGEPLNSTPSQLELLRQHSEAAFSFFAIPIKNGIPKLVFNLKPGEVHYFEISVPSASANTRFVNADDFKIWDKAFELKYLEKYKK